MSMEFTREPAAQHFVISAEGLEEAEEFDALEMYIIEDTMYMSIAGQWISAPADESVLQDDLFLNANELLEDYCGGTRQQDTTLNGVQVHHWTFTQDDMEACMTPDELTEMGEITDAGGALYVSAEDNYVVRMEFYVEGNQLDASLGGGEETLDEGRLEVVYDVTDVNQPFTIEVPPEALEGATVPEDIPVMDDAQEVASFMGMITYTSPSAADAVASFYEEQLPANGWTGGEMSEFGGMYMFSDYTKEGRTLSVNISFDEETEQSQVFISVEE
jgi:hypothetical protein